jgi:hypothetical protein
MCALNVIATIVTPQADQRLGAWYGQSTVNFWGYQMSPAWATLIDFTWSLLAMTGVAIGEETISCGIATGEFGTVVSAPIFGAIHLGNLFVQEPTTRNCHPATELIRQVAREIHQEMSLAGSLGR